MKISISIDKTDAEIRREMEETGVPRESILRHKLVYDIVNDGNSSFTTTSGDNNLVSILTDAEGILRRQVVDMLQRK